jgi:hypothetical protein
MEDYINKNIINNLYLIFENIKINKNEKKVLYPFLQSKLKNIYKKIIKKKSIFKNNIKFDDHFLFLFANIINNLTITSNKQIGGLILNINERKLINYIILNKTNSNSKIIILLKKYITYIEKYIDKYIDKYNKKYIDKYSKKNIFIKDKSKNIDDQLVIYINTSLKIYEFANNANNKNKFLEMEYKYLNNLIINYFETYKIDKNIKLEKLINNFTNISIQTDYNLNIYCKLLFTFFYSKILDVNKFVKKIIFLIIIIYGIILLEYYFSKINNENSTFLFYFIIFYLILLEKNIK